MTPREAPLLRVLLALRGLRAPADRPLWHGMAEGFVLFDDDTIVAISKPWRVRGARTGLSNSLLLSAYAEFVEPGWPSSAWTSGQRTVCS